MFIRFMVSGGPGQPPAVSPLMSGAGPAVGGNRPPGGGAAGPPGESPQENQIWSGVGGGGCWKNGGRVGGLVLELLQTGKEL